MTDKLRFTRAQIRNAAVIAKDEGVRIKLDPDGSIFVFPDNHRHEMVDVSSDNDLDRELDAFKVKYGYS